MAGGETLAPRRAKGMLQADPQAGADVTPPPHSFQIVLRPLSHPELAEIGIDETLFPVGRNEPPFDTYPADAVADLSRRHARIFCENGIIHIADMGSKNGTAVNGIDVRQKTARLQQGDELQFGRGLKFQVQLRAHAPVPVARLLSLTLQPEDGATGLQPIVIAQFPFLISKADATFSRYREAHAQQVNFLSRRHAHVFLKRGLPQVEDLGSTNGTFVNGRRLDEHATPLEEGDTVGFGGRFFVYRVVLQKEDVAADPTLTRYTGIPVRHDATQPGAPVASVAPAMPGATPQMRFDIDRTTFIGAPNSFLEIFCVDSAPEPDVRAAAANDGNGRREPVLVALYASAPPDGGNQDGAAGPVSGGSGGTGVSRDGATPPAGGASGGEAVGTNGSGSSRSGYGNSGAAHRRRNQVVLLAGEIAAALSADDRKRLKWAAIACGAGVLLAGALGVATHLYTGDEREIRTLAAAGKFDQAVRVADRYLAQHPDNTEIRQLATQSWLKAFVPQWLAATNAGDTARAAAILKEMRSAAQHMPDVAPLLREPEWIGELDRFVGPGAERPIRIDADEQRIAALLGQWDADASGHQRAAGSIAAQVPAFREAYAAALSRLRRLQGDSAVYLAAIERFRSMVAVQLNNDHPETIGALVNTYAEKYPRLAGLERYEADLQQYLRLQSTLQNGRLGAIVAQLEGAQSGAQWSTPAFQARLQALVAARRLPDATLLQRYRNVRTAWRAGETERALAALQTLASGTWGAAAASELRHKAEIIARFKAIKGAAGTPGHAERLLAFHDLLDADEDGYFIHAAQADPAVGRTRLLQRADAYDQQASRSWQQYRQAGAPDDTARRDDSAGASFPAQARLLAQARGAAQQAERLYHLLETPLPTPARRRLGEILVEAAAQRNALRDAQPALPPELLAARLALLDASATTEIVTR